MDLLHISLPLSFPLEKSNDSIRLLTVGVHTHAYGISSTLCVRFLPSLRSTSSFLTRDLVTLLSAVHLPPVDLSFFGDDEENIIRITDIHAHTHISQFEFKFKPNDL